MAEKFGKRHDSILRDIDNLISDSTKVWSEMFIESSYKNERGKIYRCFDMNRDAFSLLCMGFTDKCGHKITQNIFFVISPVPNNSLIE